MESLVNELKIHFVFGKCYRFEREDYDGWAVGKIAHKCLNHDFKKKNKFDCHWSCSIV